MFHFAYEMPLVAIREASVREQSRIISQGNSQGSSVRKQPRVISHNYQSGDDMSGGTSQRKGDMLGDVSRVLPDKTKPKQHMLYDS